MASACSQSTVRTSLQSALHCRLVQLLPQAEQWSHWVGNAYKCDGMYLKTPAKPAVGELVDVARLLRMAQPHRCKSNGCYAAFAKDPTLCCAAGCIAMPGYRLYPGLTVDCGRYPGEPSCNLGAAGPQLPAPDMIQACNLDSKCLAVATSGQMKVRPRLPVGAADDAAPVLHQPQLVGCKQLLPLAGCRASGRALQTWTPSPPHCPAMASTTRYPGEARMAPTALEGRQALHR